MLQIKNIKKQTERIEEWPNGHRVTERARERIREIQLNWDSLRSLCHALSALVDGAHLVDFLSRAGILLTLHYFSELMSILF